jgi:ABC-type multidrug transport system fused ATPase/permease subunit
MAEEKRFTKATWQIMEQLLEVDNLDDALSGSLEIIVGTLNSEAGAIWLLDPKTDRLSPMFHIGPADISNITVENGLGIEGVVTKTGKSVIVEDAVADPRFDGTVFDDNGLVTKTMICVPLNNLHDVIGCVQIVNKKDGTLYDSEELKLCERMASLAAITIDEKGLTVDLGEKKEVLATLKNVTKEFPSGDGVLKVLKGINLEIYKNEFVVVLGESGCGKSTMMNIVGGMDFLTDGELTVEGKDFSHPSDAELTAFRREKRLLPPGDGGRRPAREPSSHWKEGLQL